MIGRILSVFTSGSDADKADSEVNSLFDIGVPFLKEKGITALILDIDQTIVSQGENDIPQMMLTHLIQLGNVLDGKVCFLTNEPTAARSASIEEQTGFKVVDTSALKPEKKAFEDALAHLGLHASKAIAVVGDRRWTDVLGGNKAGLFTVRVLPKSPSRDAFGVSLVRPIEEYSASSSKLEAFSLLAAFASITGFSLWNVIGFIFQATRNIGGQINFVQGIAPHIFLGGFCLYCLLYLRFAHVRNRNGLRNLGNPITYFFNTYPLALRVIVALALLVWVNFSAKLGAGEIGAIYFFSFITILSSFSSLFKFYHTSMGRFVRVIMDVFMFVFLAHYLVGFQSLVPLAFLTVPIATSSRYHGVATAVFVAACSFVSVYYFVEFGDVLGSCALCQEGGLKAALLIVFFLAYFFTGLVFSLEYSELFRPFAQMASRFSPQAGNFQNDLPGYLENSALVLGCSELIVVDGNGKGQWFSRTFGNTMQTISGEDADEIASFVAENKEFLLELSDNSQRKIDAHSSKFRRIETALAKPVKDGVKSALAVSIPQMPEMSVIALNCLTRNGALRSQFSVQHLIVLRMIALGLGASITPFTSSTELSG